MGLQYSNFIGYKIAHNKSVEITENWEKRHRKSRDDLLYDSETKVSIVGGAGDASKLVVKGDEATLDSGSAKITLKKDGHIEIKSPKKIMIKAESDDVEISGKKIIITANDKTDLKYAPITHKYIKIG
jgi:hypothetical protein